MSTLKTAQFPLCVEAPASNFDDFSWRLEIMLIPPNPKISRTRKFPGATLSNNTETISGLAPPEMARFLFSDLLYKADVNTTFPWGSPLTEYWIWS